MTETEKTGGWWDERVNRLALLHWACKGGRWPRWVDADRRRRLQMRAAEIDAAVRDKGYRPGK
jgi:hypothetical protein